MVWRTMAWLMVVTLAAACVRGGDDECEPGWVKTFGATPGVTGASSGMVYTMARSADGPGSALYMAGQFRVNGTHQIATWKGSRWGSIPGWFERFTGPVILYALANHDDGSGPVLYAAGTFDRVDGLQSRNIVRWDGTAWSAFGTGANSAVYSLAEFDDGAGPTLYVAGAFTSIDGTSALRVAKWDGTSWSPVGAGFSSGYVRHLAVLDDGTGPALYAGGTFAASGGVTLNGIAKWDGENWTPLGTGVIPGWDVIRALTMFDDGSGLQLYAAGEFSTIGGVTARNVARWDGFVWSPVGGGIPGSRVSALELFDDGSGMAIYAGGSVPWGVRKWDGEEWVVAGEGLYNSQVQTLAVLDDGAEPLLYAGGYIPWLGDGTIGMNVAKWDGAGIWTAPGTGLSGIVTTIASVEKDDMSGLYVGGSPRISPDVHWIGKWNGAEWAPLGSGVNGGVRAIAVDDKGTEPVLYAGGSFTTAGGEPANRVAKWDGESWAPLGNGIANAVLALMCIDLGQGPVLYAGSRSGGDKGGIWQWDGESWQLVGGGMGGGSSYDFPSVEALASGQDWDPGTLYVGGWFKYAAGKQILVNHIARWDGTTWSSLGNGTDGTVRAIAIFDDGAGPALYVGGSFWTVGGLQATRGIAKWDGSEWSSVGGGMNGSVNALEVFDDGSGAALYAGGSFTEAGGMLVNRLAKWDGQQWQAVGSGVDNNVLALASHRDDMGSALFVGGEFVSGPDSGDSYIAKWRGCAGPVPPCVADFNGDTVVDTRDVVAFLNAFVAQDSSADINGDTVIDTRDVVAFLNAYVAGCD